MKQIINTFLFFLPLLCYGQTTVFDVTDTIYSIDYNNAHLAIQAAYEDAKLYAQSNNNAPTKVYIPAGYYYLQLGNTTLIDMDQGPHNITIEGAGMNQTKLIADGFGSKLFSVVKTDNVTIKGLHLTRIGTPFFQGTVETKLGNNKVIVRRSDGFENPIFLDQNSGSQHTLWKITNSLSAPKSHPDMRSKKKVKKIEADTSDSNLFIFSGSNWNGIFNVGDRVTMKAKYGDGMIKTSRADNITIENITITNTGASAIRITSGEKEFTVRNVHVKRGQAVNAAGEVPYYTCGGGGFSFTHGNGNSIMENCSIEGTGDDPFSIHTKDDGDINNPPHLIIKNNTFQDVHGDLYLANLHNAEFYDNTIIRTNLQITNRSAKPSHHIVLRNNEFIENVRSGTIRISGLNDYNSDTSQWHHNIEIYDNTFINTGTATSVVKFQLAKDVVFRDNVIDNFTNAVLYNPDDLGDTSIVHFDNLDNYTPALLNTLQGENNCIINTTATTFATHQTSSLYNIANSNICVGFCVDPNINNSNLCQLALPVELINFEGIQNHDNHVLHWQTASETNHKGFEIQRSTDALTWQHIGFLAPTPSQNYRFHDKSPLAGNNYYRLKQIDFDANYTFSPIVLLHHTSTAFDCTLSPNPSTGHFVVNFNDSWNLSPITLKLINTHGQVLWIEHTLPSSPTLPLQFDKLDKGLYYLSIITAGQKTTKKIIIN